MTTLSDTLIRLLRESGSHAIYSTPKYPASQCHLTPSVSVTLPFGLNSHCGSLCSDMLHFSLLWGTHRTPRTILNSSAPTPQFPESYP